MMTGVSMTDASTAAFEAECHVGESITIDSAVSWFEVCRGPAGPLQKRWLEGTPNVLDGTGRV
jgi:hypothetical protein